MNGMTEFLRRHRQVVVLLALTIMTWSVAAVAVDGFATANSSRNILLQVVTLAIVGAGQTVVVIAGGIDLSTPWMITVTAILVTFLTGGQDATLVWVLPAVFGVALVVGAVNGLGVGLLRIHPIIMTLASNVILGGAIVLVTGTIPPAVAPPAIKWLGQGALLGVPAAFILLAAVTAATISLLSLTTFGRRLYSIGSSETVSLFSGIQPLGVIVTAYMVSSAAAALGGIFLLGYVGVAFPGMGDNFLFSSVAAVVVGGASILGGKGGYFGTLVGASLLTLINILMVVFSMSAGAVSIFYGLTILLSVWLGSVGTAGSGRWWHRLFRRPA
jgi:ribose transport system permease protein